MSFSGDTTKQEEEQGVDNNYALLERYQTNNTYGRGVSAEIAATNKEEVFAVEPQL